jgi:hypothetical protein
MALVSRRGVWSSGLGARYGLAGNRRSRLFESHHASAERGFGPRGRGGGLTTELDALTGEVIDSPFCSAYL